MVRLMARKAVAKEPGQAPFLADIFCRARYDDEASEILKAYRVTTPGSSHYDRATDTYTITGIGADIWDSVDEFHFAHKALIGDGSITARIDVLEHVHE